MALAFSILLAACGSTTAPTPTAEITPSPTATPSQTPSLTPDPTPSGLPAGMAYADLDGVVVSEELAHRLPMAIMIDDNKPARPQSGFSSASIVYQAPADGGEDRYMMVFQEGTASDIGPVRSARPYFVYWAAEYKALYGHYGGDSESLNSVIPSLSSAIYDMDALRSGGACPYHRITTRPMPHNGYTNSQALIDCLLKRGIPSTYQDTPVRQFKDDAPAEQRPASGSITVPYPTGTISYTYDPATNSYARFIAGKAQIDLANNEPVKPRNVVVLFQALSYKADKRPVVANVGSDKALIFRDGTVILGTWKKDSKTDLTRLYDSTGVEIELVRGQIFIQSVPLTTKVTY